MVSMCMCTLCSSNVLHRPCYPRYGKHHDTSSRKAVLNNRLEDAFACRCMSGWMSWWGPARADAFWWRARPAWARAACWRRCSIQASVARERRSFVSGHQPAQHTAARCLRSQAVTYAPFPMPCGAPLGLHASASSCSKGPKNILHDFPCALFLWSRWLRIDKQSLQVSCRIRWLPEITHFISPGLAPT